MRGIIAENLISAFAIIISIILVFLIVGTLFSSQSQRAAEASYSDVARDLARLVDRAGAEAGSAFMSYQVPEGLHFDLTLGHRAVEIDSGRIQVKSPFSAETHTESYTIEDPRNLCIVKNRYDRRIRVVEGNCSCNLEDGTCNPECAVEGECDPDCRTEEKDQVCLPGCHEEGDGLCDPDCYRNEPDLVWDPDCVKGERDEVCDPDSDGIEDGMCDVDCLLKYNFTPGVCDPDCVPEDGDGDGIEDEGDGICFAGCSEKTYTIQGGGGGAEIPEEAFCQQPETKPDIHVGWEYYQCLGDRLYNCGEYLGTCAVPCHQPTANHSEPAGCIVGVDMGSEYSESDVDSCCCVDGECQIMNRGDCITTGGYAYRNDSSYCRISQGNGGEKKIFTNIQLKKDGVCDLDCANSTDICDPDCSDELEQCVPCTPENESYIQQGKPCCSGLTPCPGTGICSQDCCGNGVCENRSQWKLEQHPSNWENNYTCEEDCGSATENRIEDCNDIDVGNFDEAPCYQDNNLTWFDEVITICSPAVEDFLDRREWDINQVAGDLMNGTGPPLGFAWDNSRYFDACQKIQNSSQTIRANEDYNLSESRCCCAPEGDMSQCLSGGYPTPQCCGVGFCIDHTDALLAILRRMGVPPKDVWATFQFAGNDCRPHSYVMYRCDQNLTDNLKLDQCEGRWGDWLRLDATGHFIEPIEESGCRTMCTWFNDQGLFATYGDINKSTGGRINSTHGWAYPPDVSCSPSTWEGMETCKAGDPSLPEISCEFNGPGGTCTREGIECLWGEDVP